MAADRCGLCHRSTITLAVVYISLLSVAHAKTHNPTATQKPLDQDGGSVQNEAESHKGFFIPKAGDSKAEAVGAERVRNTHRPQNAQATLTGTKRVEFESCIANTAVRFTAVLATPVSQSVQRPRALALSF
jgi:hypothetical protein